jgi:transcription initiation factor IIE alpha subunit
VSDVLGNDSVVLGGKELSIKQVKEKFSGHGLLYASVVQKIVSMIHEQSYPVDTKSISEATGISLERVRRSLRRMIETNLVIGFSLCHSRTRYYALTVYGTNLAERKGVFDAKV